MSISCVKIHIWLSVKHPTGAIDDVEYREKGNSFFKLLTLEGRDIKMKTRNPWVRYFADKSMDWMKF